MAFVVLTNVSSIEGRSGIMAFYEFVPIGVLPGIVSLPIKFGVRR